MSGITTQDQPQTGFGWPTLLTLANSVGLVAAFGYLWNEHNGIKNRLDLIEDSLRSIALNGGFIQQQNGNGINYPSLMQLAKNVSTLQANLEAKDRQFQGALKSLNLAKANRQNDLEQVGNLSEQLQALQASFDELSDLLYQTPVGDDLEKASNQRRRTRQPQTQRRSNPAPAPPKGIMKPEKRPSQVQFNEPRRPVQVQTQQPRRVNLIDDPIEEEDPIDAEIDEYETY